MDRQERHTLKTINREYKRLRKAQQKQDATRRQRRAEYRLRAALKHNPPSADA